MRDSVNNRGNPTDDIESAAPQIYSFVKRHLGLTGCGNDQMAFSRNILAPLVTQSTSVYAALRSDIFTMRP